MGGRKRGGVKEERRVVSKKGDESM